MTEIKFYDLGFTLRCVNVRGDKVDLVGPVLARAELIDPFTEKVAHFGWVKPMDRGPTQAEIDNSIRLGMIAPGDVPALSGSPAPAPAADEATPAPPVNWRELNKPDLVDLMDSLGLATDGTKEALLERMAVYEGSMA